MNIPDYQGSIPECRTHAETQGSLLMRVVPSTQVEGEGGRICWRHSLKAEFLGLQIRFSQ